MRGGHSQFKKKKKIFLSKVKESYWGEGRCLFVEQENNFFYGHIGVETQLAGSQRGSTSTLQEMEIPAVPRKWFESADCDTIYVHYHSIPLYTIS